MRTNILLALALAAPGLWAQNVISAKAGLIHFAQGDVTLEGKKVRPKNGEFPVVANGETLATADAKAEVLLTPGVFLRLGGQSSFKMVSNQLSDTRVEMLTGSAMVEVDDLSKGNSIMLLYRGAKITPLKHGLYRLDASENRFRVFEGEAQVIQGDETTQVKGGHQIEFGAVFLASKFNRKTIDSLDAWASERSERIAQANFTSANMVSRGGSSAYTNSSWVWNPYFGLFTYLPATGFGYNPYGWMIFSPRTIGYYNAYQQPATYSGYQAANGYSGEGARAAMSSAPAMSASPSVGVAAAPSSAGVASMGRGSVSSGGGGRGR